MEAKVKSILPFFFPVVAELSLPLSSSTSPPPLNLQIYEGEGSY